MSAVGEYRIFMSTPIGDKDMTVTVNENGGTIESEANVYDLSDFSVDADSFSGSARLKTPMGEIEATLRCNVDADGTVTGELLTPFMPIVVEGRRV